MNPRWKFAHLRQLLLSRAAPAASLAPATRATRVASIARIASIAPVALAALLAAPAVAADAPALTWKTKITPPATATPDPKVAPFQPLCGAADAALAATASRNVQRQLGGSEIFAADELAFTLRAAGDPHVWPRAFSIEGGPFDDDALKKKVKGWMDGWSTLGVRRCGIAKGAKDGGTTVFSVVALDALADMVSLPVTARVSQWITLEAKMLVPASAAKVVLLGPRGAPKTVVASLTKDTIKSTFSVDQSGQWLVQVLATVSTGPRPVLESLVFAGVTPPTKFTRATVPGEDAAKEVKDAAEAVFKMLNTARVAEGSKSLTRDATLDKLAKAHSDQMAKVKMVGHDVGSGDPKKRIKDAGITAKIAGENVASAATPQNAHRALWASPSHRSNMLSGDFTRVGIAVTKDAEGRLWVTQLYAG
ncbi:MAG: CAP domain-containing protein [Polyangiaceae bacterium]